MKGKIDENGFLYIERAGKTKKTLCPYDGECAPCGDWCPLFSEPEPAKDAVYPDDDSCNYDLVPNGKTWMRLCHGKYLEFDEFTDEREAQDEGD